MGERLKDKTAVITGAASGIGRAIAIKFASEGARVVVGDITEEPREGGDPTVSVIRESGGSAEYVHTDVSKREDVDKLIGRAVRQTGRLDIIVNNAATAVDKPLTETTEEQWERVIGVNLTGVFLGCKRAVSQMLTQKVVNDSRGRIVNISSQHGMIAAPNNFAYGVSKSGVVYMTRQIAADYAEDHIICNAVAPGRILTGKPISSADPLEYSKSRTPMPRLGCPEDVARAALFLASDESTYITGENLMVDGGWMAG